MTAQYEFFCSPEMTKGFEQISKIEFENKEELNSITVEKGIICPLELSETNKAENMQFGGVCTENGDFVKQSLQRRYNLDGIGEMEDWYKGVNPAVHLDEIDYIDEDVVYIGPIKKHFAHFYLETLSRTWFFLNEDNLKYKIAYLSQDGDKPDKNTMEDFFTLLGLKMENLIEIKTTTKFKSVVVPDQSFILNRSCHRLYKETIDKIKSAVPSANCKKVYFSKKFNWENSNRTVGDNLSEKIFKENGYEVFYPEKMSVRETLSVLKGCEEFVAQSASNAHNAIFLKDSARVIILNRSEHFHPTQLMFDKMKNLKTVYVDSFYNILPLDCSYGPFSFCYTTYLDEFLNKYGFKYNKRRLKKESSKNLLLYIKTWSEFYARFKSEDGSQSTVFNADVVANNIRQLELKDFTVHIAREIKRIFKL